MSHVIFLMLLTSLLAGLLIPVVSFVMGWLGLVPPFYIELFGRRISCWAFWRKRPVEPVETTSNYTYTTAEFKLEQ